MSVQGQRALTWASPWPRETEVGDLKDRGTGHPGYPSPSGRGKQELPEEQSCHCPLQICTGIFTLPVTLECPSAPAVPAPTTPFLNFSLPVALLPPPARPQQAQECHSWGMFQGWHCNGINQLGGGAELTQGLLPRRAQIQVCLFHLIFIRK